ncbi:type I 3-dehydroquinate dehydratase [Patescibacteria group bacterium]|nr:type I 3-dehydroquinate dehydratase [Patescibacteria group bacterium]
MICVPIKARSLGQLKKKAAAVPGNVDLIEVWIDHLPKDLDPDAIIGACHRPLIIVNKPRRERGLWRGSEAARIQRLLHFIRHGVAFIDIGMDSGDGPIKALVKEARKARGKSKKKTKIIVSYHNFTLTPPVKILEEKVKKGFALGADMVKIATFARSEEDNITVISLLEGIKKPLIALCMGEKGKISRLAGKRLGSAVNYLAIGAGAKSAPGQLTITEYERFDCFFKKN